MAIIVVVPWATKEEIRSPVGIARIVLNVVARRIGTGGRQSCRICVPDGIGVCGRLIVVP